MLRKDSDFMSRFNLEIFWKFIIHRDRPFSNSKMNREPQNRVNRIICHLTNRQMWSESATSTSSPYSAKVVSERWEEVLFCTVCWIPTVYCSPLTSANQCLLSIPYLIWVFCWFKTVDGFQITDPPLDQTTRCSRWPSFHRAFIYKAFVLFLTIFHIYNHPHMQIWERKKTKGL